MLPRAPLSLVMFDHILGIAVLVFGIVVAGVTWVQYEEGELPLKRIRVRRADSPFVFVIISLTRAMIAIAFMIGGLLAVLGVSQ